MSAPAPPEVATFVEEPFMVVTSASAPPETAAALIPELLVFPGASIHLMIAYAGYTLKDF